jgi:hypothetical protein
MKDRRLCDDRGHRRERRQSADVSEQRRVTCSATAPLVAWGYPRRMKQRRTCHEPRRYNHLRRHEHKNSSSSGCVLVGLGLIGAAAVGGWALASPEQQAAAVSTAKQVVVATGAVRECAPQGGEHWSGCKDARAAGTAPIYRGEPSNREAWTAMAMASLVSLTVSRRPERLS